MSEQQKIPRDEFFKALGELESQAGISRESKEDLEKSQLFHTGKSSEKTSWAGGEGEKYGDNWKDNIGEDGTDYHPARKAIAQKVLKGQPLAPEDLSILSGDLNMAIEKSEEAEHQMGYVSKASEEDKDKPATEEKDKAACMSKSFEENVQGNETLQNALELSDFLREFSGVFSKSLGRLEQRTAEMVSDAANSILKQVGSYMDERFGAQSKFNKSLAEAVVNIGHGVAGTLDHQNELGNQPVGPPRAQLGGARPIEKSFQGGGDNGLSKAQKLDIMCDLVQKGQLNPLEVTRFETTNFLRPEIDTMINKAIQSGN